MMAVGSYVEVDDWEARAWAELPDGVEHGVITDCAVDAEDNVYLACRSGPLVLVYAHTGQFLRSWGQNVPGNRPHGITVAPDGSVLIASDKEHTVRRYTPSGEELQVIGVSGVPSDTAVGDWSLGLAKRLLSIQHSAGPFNGPTRIAVAPSGDLYVSDGYGNARVHQFTPSGELVRSWGEPGPGPGQFYLPHGLGVAPDGRVLVADQQNDRVQVFSSDGAWLEEWADLYHPLQVVVVEGFVYVAEGSTPASLIPTDHCPPESASSISMVTLLQDSGKKRRMTPRA
jgi:DNA-binding beta-propeller fold protein YncE